MTKLHEKYGKDGFKVLAVNDWDEPAATVGKFAQQSKLTHKILLMGGKISPKLYGVVSSPTSFWIDHKGIIRGRSVGFNVAHVPQMEQKIEKMLGDLKKKK
ncbi:MAG: hypothetical protein CMJ91_01490 [Planctomycetes bacterium]|nr:hypothetical protein [Planctomycetota bacterium]MBL05033.1 hypothetical protein [Planctomycetota bacterium]